MIIEGLLVLVVLGTLWVLLLNWLEKRKTKKLQINYNPSNDKSKQGEERKHITTRDTGIKRRNLKPTKLEKEMDLLLNKKKPIKKKK